MEKVEAKQICHHHMHRYVRVVLADGRVFDGFVENVDDDHLHLAVPVGHEMYCDHMENASFPNENNMAPIGGCGCHSHLQPTPYGTTQSYGTQSCESPGGYPGVDVRAFVPGYYPPGFGYNPYGRRRFNRLILPLFLLTALSVLPFY
ncbi:hypothetical protein [Paenibacillus glacialis]|uniref:Phosphatidylinositol kinase n=1 Tax=Paenibacillus glacialis TaxID=494026 RepID=A0A168D884_9BACL|nr:hypothetical protein [Paenibacillus glacialis]OAB33962.1 hypothetical protein PGLA_23955 [Paenibacillus glacialis]